MKSKNSFSLNLTLTFKPYVTVTGPRRPNVLPMWPARQKELPTPAIAYTFIDHLSPIAVESAN